MMSTTLNRNKIFKNNSKGLMKDQFKEFKN